MTNKHTRPTIETIINTAAIALTASGTTMILQRDYYGFVCIGLGMLLEFYKYWGRKKKFW